MYALLANADNSKVIRSINSVRKHKVLSDKGDVQAARAQHDICGGPKIARLEFTLDINFTFFPETYSGEFELDSPAGMRLYKVSRLARPTTAPYVRPARRPGRSGLQQRHPVHAHLHWASHCETPGSASAPPLRGPTHKQIHASGVPCHTSDAARAARMPTGELMFAVCLQGKFRAADVETSGNKVLSVSKHGAGQPCASIDANELYNDDLPVADASSSSGATSGQCLLWVQQEIEPDVPQKLPPRTVRGVLRRASRKEMSQFVDVRSEPACADPWCARCIRHATWLIVQQI